MEIKSVYGLTVMALCYMVIFSLASCEGENEIVEPIPQSEIYPNVAKELRPYFMRFEAAGSERSLNIDLTTSRITGVIEEISKENVIGKCSYSYHDPKKVTVDLEFWSSASDLYKEFIVFHELGHCYLGRDHLEESFPNGRCISIMRSGLGDCWDFYNGRTQKEYVDELFDQYTEL